MATEDDGRAPRGSGGAGEKSHKRPFRPEIIEDPQNVSHEAGKINSSGVSDQGGHSASISDLEQMLNQKTFTSSETQRLIALLHSRTIQESTSESDGAKPPSPTSPPPLLRLEASTSVLEEQIASPVELAKPYKGSTISTQDSSLINNNNNATSLPKTQMASPRHPSTMENLPGELLYNIFIRLLAKQLAQMRCVSKSWNALLSQSSFIKSHLGRSIHNNEPVLLVFYNEGFPFGSKLPIRSPRLEPVDVIKLPLLNPESEHTSGKVIGSVNGLICFSDGPYIRIWNPSLSAVLTLPPSSMVFDHRYEIYLRFGFDPKTDDYKVVKLAGLTGPHTHAEYIVKEWRQIEVYSLKKGSWELISQRFPSHVTSIFDDDFVCVDGHDGHLHWSGCIREPRISQTIVAFDMGSETFSEIPLPDLIGDLSRCTNHLGVLGGKLCIMSWVRYAPCEVWVMDEYGVGESWVKRHIFSHFDYETHPFGFISHNELLVEDYYDCLVSYDPVANKAKVLENYGPGKYSVNKIMKYIDSLVWVTPAQREMVNAAGHI